MKNLRKILLAIVTVVAFASCGTDADTVAEIKDEAGLLVNVSATSNSSILGNPAPGVDLGDAEVTVTNAYLNMTVNQTAGSITSLQKIEIVKSYNGGEEISLGESTSLPYNLEVASLDELLAGTGVAATDLRIGDVLNFKTKIYKTDGSVYYFNSSMGDYSLVVNCASNLAGSYTINYTSGPAIYNVTEVSPGLYESDQMIGWPTSGYWVRFTDTCGMISFDINDWRFAASNPVAGNGFVDADGNLVWSDITVGGIGAIGTTWTMYKN
ncbi:hypothetical protein [Algibacter sp.]|uniref:hypothetical protein n=1 Tax=Algibacter sp. TaxID=1872428 RepID=UPI003C78F7C3